MAPIFGPASQKAQYPSGTINGTIGSGAILDVLAYTGAGSDQIATISIVSGARGLVAEEIYYAIHVVSLRRNCV